MKKKNENDITKPVLIFFAILAVFITYVLTNTCEYSGCGRRKEKGSSYCSFHSTNTSYRNQSSSGSYRRTTSTSDSTYKSNSSGNSSSKNSTKNSYGSSYSKNSTKNSYGSSSSKNSTKNSYGSSSSRKSSSGSSGWKSYDSGYDSVYDDGDYDWDRYRRDDEYARGVDDAMDELEDDW